MVVMVRQLYQRCRLVHADLSGVCRRRGRWWLPQLGGSSGPCNMLCEHAICCMVLPIACRPCHPQQQSIAPCLILPPAPCHPAEYNGLVHDNELWCIDVSQAVELDHPRAFDFLREGGWVLLGLVLLWVCVCGGGKAVPVSASYPTSCCQMFCWYPLPSYAPSPPPPSLPSLPSPLTSIPLYYNPPCRLPARQRLLPPRGGGYADNARAV